MPVLEPDYGTIPPLPSGWSWYSPPRTGHGEIILGRSERQGSLNYGSNVEALVEWARSLDVAIRGTQGAHVLCPNGVATAYSAVRWRVDLAESFIDPAFTLTCSGCQSELSWTDTFCEQCQTAVICRSCMHGATLRRIEPTGEPGRSQWGCNRCYGSCLEQDCNRVGVLGPGLCPDHAVMVNCSNCDNVREQSNTTMIQDRQFCSDCALSRCQRCGEDGTHEDEVTQRLLCLTHYTEAQSGRMEEWDDVELSDDFFTIPTLPNRPVRVVSVEQEYCLSNATGTARRVVPEGLYNLGVCWSADQLPYHAGKHEHACHVESDSTVNGGELIYNRLKLDRPEDSTAMGSILGFIREKVQDQTILFDIRCGLHIHVDLHGYDLTDVRNLVTMFNWMEDPIFRLAGSGYPEHRAISHASRYAAPVIKGNWKSNREFGLQFLRNADHTDALNLMWFYRTLREGCRCGSVEFGDISDCECNRGKATAEWRVFNGTANPRRLHAYLAFVQSLHAWVQGRVIDPDQFIPLELTSRVSFATDERTDAHTELMEAWKPRVEFWFTHLSMTDNERESMLYTIRNSPLSALGEEYISNLTSLERIPDDREVTAPDRAARMLDGASERPRRFRDPDDSDYCGWCGDHYDDCGCRWCDRHDTNSNDCGCPPEVSEDIPFPSPGDRM